MLIVPLVFCSLVSGVTAMNDSSKMGRVAIKSIAFYLTTRAVAITIGLLLGSFLAPGKGMNLVAPVAESAGKAPSIMDTLVAMIPALPTRLCPWRKVTFCRLLSLPCLLGQRGKALI